MELLKIVAPQQGGNQQISRQMEDLRDRLDSALRIADQLTGPSVKPAADQVVTEVHIRDLQKLRRQRSCFFADELFADPAWDILLELYAAELGQFRVSVSILCVAAAVPPTTALRWISQLERNGLVTRRADPTDGRRVFLALSPTGLDAMTGYFRTVPVGASLI